MTGHFLPLFIILVIGIALIVVLTTRYKVPAFYALFLACIVVGMGSGSSLAATVSVMKDGFGNILKSLGFIIVLGTALGLLLEYTGATGVMATFLLKRLGHKRSALAMAITGFIIGLPIFCDSGFIVLSGLNKSMARRTGVPIAFMSVSLAAGLYAIHCLAPPHPGATAAAATIGVDFGKLLLVGMFVSIPAILAGYAWARYAGRNTTEAAIIDDEILDDATHRKPSLIKSFLPIIIPVILIGAKSFLVTNTSANHGWQSILSSLGDPVMALLIGVLLAFNCKRSWTRAEAGKILQDAAEKAGGILVIIGMGGAFGAVITATNIGGLFSHSLLLSGTGILFPFLLTSVLKTAQGSSTVAIITAAPIVLPLLPSLGLDSETGRLLCVLAMGGGSMMISHANDAYFWVVAKFSGIEMKSMLRVYSVATMMMGLTTFCVVYILSKLL